MPFKRRADSWVQAVSGDLGKANVNEIFYRPRDAAVGDVIPYYANGEFKLFYLHIWRVPEEMRGERGWYLLGTNDFVHYREDGPCKIQGGTGSVLEAGGLYHMFYCKFPHGRQIVCHATSTDLAHWDKYPEEDFGPDITFYEASDWRDPLVFWNEEEGLYWMLIAARARSQFNRSGCVGLCVSSDLKIWQARPPLLAPNLNMSALECPDLFRMGDWWYLLYSTYTDHFVTQYRMSRSLNGPWLAPAVDTFDGRAYYAAKTASDGQKRYLFGWNPTRTENLYHWNPPGYGGRDFNTWDWGGELVVHEVRQEGDGTLGVALPPSVAAAFQPGRSVELQPALGHWDKVGGGYRASCVSGLACATAGPLPARCLISARFSFAPCTRRVGIIVRASEQLDKGYHIQIEPDRNRVIFKSCVFDNEHGGKIPPFEVELERPLALAPAQSYLLTVVLVESVCEVYLNNQVAMSTRMYDLSEGKLAFFVADGEATFEDIVIEPANSPGPKQ